MRIRVVAIVVALASLTVLGFTASPAGAQPAVLQASLTGGAVPDGRGDLAGSGFAYAVVDDASDRICVVVLSRGIAPATVVHIHKGVVGQVGPHAVDLNDSINTGAGGISSGCYSAPEQVLDDIAANPAGYYVNVHNHPHPLGAVRGQLTSLTTF